jgi:hypothetical protein
VSRVTEIAVRYVTIAPKIATGFSSEINAAVGKGAAQAGRSAGKQVGDGLDHGVKQSASKVGTAFKSVVTGALVLGGISAVSGFVRKSVDAFSEYEDAAEAAKVVFGDSMKSIMAQANSAAATMGMNKAQVIDASNTFGTLGKSADLAGDDLAGFSTQMTSVAADLSSFKGGSPEEAILAVGAALRGESEPIRRYGVLLDDMTLRQQALKMGLIESVKEGLTPQQRVLAAQAEILKQTTDAQGDYLRNADSTANVQKRLAAESANLSIDIGEKLAPAIVSAQKAGITFLRWVTDNQERLVPLVATVGLATAAIGGFVAVAKGVEAIKAARVMIQGLGDAYAQMSTKARVATASAGAIGIALTAAAVVYGVFAQRNTESAIAVDEFTEALEASNGALDTNISKIAQKLLMDRGAISAAEDLNINLGTMTQAALGNADAMKEVGDRLAEVRQAEVEAIAATGGMDLSMSSAEQSAGILEDALGRTSTELQQAVEKQRQMATAADEAERKQSTQITTTATAKMTFEEYTKAINGSYNAQLKLAGSERAAEAAIDEGAERIAEWTAELTKKYEEEIKATAAAKGRKISDEEAGKQAEKRANKEVKAAIASGEALDINTEAGRKNEEALHAIADTTLAAMAGMTDLDIASGKAAERAERGREEFLKLAEKLGVGAEEAEDLAEKLGLVKSKTVALTVDVKWRGTQVRISSTGPTLKAAGGAIRGPGTGTSDDVPILASNGEWVIKEKSARYYGPAVMDAINQGRIPREAFAGKYASGGPVMPTYKGHSLDWWDDYLLTDLESTRLQIRIKDLKANLAEKETYYTGKGKKRKKKKRYKLRDLERTEAQLELKEAEEQLRLAKDAAKVNASTSGTIAEQIARYETQQKLAEDAAASWQSAAAALGKGSFGSALSGSWKAHRDAAGNTWYSGSSAVDVDALNRQRSAEGDAALAFLVKIDKLRQMGAPKRLVDDILALGPVEGSRVADAYLAKPAAIQGANDAYDKIAMAQSGMEALGALAGEKAAVTVNVTTVNPQAEKPSETVNRALQYAAQIGVGV